jgi:hypothetical protein
VLFLTELQDEDFGSSDDDYLLTRNHSKYKKKRSVREEEEPEEEVEPDMETLSAVIKLEVEILSCVLFHAKYMKLTCNGEI